jgi:hypothetical protein
MPNTMVTFTTCALAVFAAGTVSAETYKWVDAQGQIHYSDRPPPAGAQQVELVRAQTYHAPATAKTATSGAAPKPASGPVGYAEFDMRKPQSGDVISNAGGTVSVELRLEPALQPGHSIWLYLDGKRVDGLSTTGSSFQLSSVFRGEHRLAAAVVNSAGKSVVLTDPVSFMVRQTSAAKPPQGPALHPPSPQPPSNP